MDVYGKNVAKEILKSGKKVEKVILDKNFNDETIKSLIEKAKIPTQYVDKNKLDRLAGKNHQGIILSIEDYHYCDIDELIKDKEKSLILILDHIEDPHNLGAIIRTAEAAGVDGIILPKNRSVLVNATVMKTSAGALQNIKISVVTNIYNTIEYLKDKGYWVVGTDIEDSVDYREIDYPDKTVLIIGSEGFGMTRLVKEACDFVARIPMYGKINSLNASVASGIMIYEIIRNRK